MENAISLVREELSRIRDAALRALQEAPPYASSLLIDLLTPADALVAALKKLLHWLRVPPR